MSSRPLFQVDEKVWLESKSNPNLNDSTFIVRVMETPSSHCTYGYLLGIEAPFHPWKDKWCQCALRKRYPPADSFASIMDSCKDKVPA